MCRDNKKARTTSIRPAARKAIRKRPLSRPSRYPSCPIHLVTPVSNPLARPSEAERVEEVKVTVKSIEDRRELSPSTMVLRLVLSDRLMLPETSNVKPGMEWR